VGLGGTANGAPREANFDITAASEVMAVLCLSADEADLRARLGRIVVGFTAERKAVTAADLGAVGAMTALLRDALRPNLVQGNEGVPALVHGGPFANIAHGANSLIATRMALHLADWVVTEAGFGMDLGGEKFFDIGRATGRRGAARGLRARRRRGSLELADAVLAMLDRSDAERPVAKYTYELGDPPEEKIRKIARTVYGADDVVFTASALKDLDAATARRRPSCPCAWRRRTSRSPTTRRSPGRPRGFTITVREVRLSAGAGFVVALTGEIMTMPGLPKVPAAARVVVHDDGRITGLMQGE
jgi:formate--tetrahydrofolate ligase